MKGYLFSVKEENITMQIVMVISFKIAYIFFGGEKTPNTVNLIKYVELGRNSVYFE